MESYLIVLTSCASQEEAEKIVQKVLKARLIACANILPGVKSFFWWKGAIDSGGESLLIIKTKKATFKALVKKVKEVHSYDVPEIIALPIVDGSGDYLKWIEDSLT